MEFGWKSVYYVYPNEDNSLLQNLQCNNRHLAAVFCGVISYGYNIQHMENGVWIEMTRQT